MSVIIYVFRLNLAELSKIMAILIDNVTQATTSSLKVRMRIQQVRKFSEVYDPN